MNDPNEVERLRARVAELETHLSKKDDPARPREPARRSVWWAVSAAILITVACVLAPLSVTSVWASNVLSDTDQYVETVAPLADDPAVQDAIANEVTTAIFTNLDVEAVTTEALETFAAQPDVPPRVAAALPGLAVPIVNGVESFTRDQVETLLASPQFATLWAEVNRIAHDQVVTLLEGNEGGAVSAQGDTITLNLGPIVAAVQDRLVERGFDLAANIPTIDRTFVLVQSDAIADAQGFYSLLNTLGLWLPIAVLVLFVAGVVLARDRRRALIKGSLGLAGAMILLGVVLALGRMWYVDTTPADILNEAAAGSVFDTMVRFLRTAIRAVGVLALVVAIGAFLAGPSSAAVKTRATLERSIGSAREGAEGAGWQTGRVGTWTYAHKRALQVTAAITGGLLLIFWTQPSGWVVLGIALAVVLALAVIEFLAQPPVAAATAAQAPSTAPGAPATAEAPEVPRQMPRTTAESTAESKAEPPAEVGGSKDR